MKRLTPRILRRRDARDRDRRTRLSGTARRSTCATRSCTTAMSSRACTPKGRGFVEHVSEVPAGRDHRVQRPWRRPRRRGRRGHARSAGARCDLPAGRQGAGPGQALRGAGAHRDPDRARRAPRGRRDDGPDPGARAARAGTSRTSQRLDISPADTPVAYVTQTTLSVDDTRTGASLALTARFADIVGPDIARHLLRDAEPAVRGARALRRCRRHPRRRCAQNSSNSNRLRCEIGVECGVPSYLIADGSELAPEWVEGAEVVGITAGASAPEDAGRGVDRRVARAGRERVSVLPGLEEHVEFRLPAELTEGFATRTVSRAS